MHYLTNDALEWDLHSRDFATRENNMLNWRGYLADDDRDLPGRVMTIYSCFEPNEDDFLKAVTNTLKHTMQSAVRTV